MDWTKEWFSRQEDAESSRREDPAAGWPALIGNKTADLSHFQQQSTNRLYNAGAWLPSIGSPNVATPDSQQRRRPSVSFICSSSENPEGAIQTSEDAQSITTESSSTMFEPEPEQPEEGMLMLGDAIYTQDEARQQLAQLGLPSGSTSNPPRAGRSVVLPPSFTGSISNEEIAQLGGLKSFPYHVDPLNLVLQLGGMGYYGTDAKYATSR
ncbi:hypothetical protein F5Y08DRAFT_346280 [Xylaria arbuscula]|nr:hypothetical protein F5Y08DRAFT_346280 [Xylaria arbuscula]